MIPLIPKAGGEKLNKQGDFKYLNVLILCNPAVAVSTSVQVKTCPRWGTAVGTTSNCGRLRLTSSSGRDDSNNCNI
jgi:hypothetical protein